MLLFSFEKSGDHVLHPTKKLKQSPTWRHRNLDDGNSNAGRQCSLSGSDPYYTVAPVVPSTLAWSRGFFSKTILEAWSSTNYGVVVNSAKSQRSSRPCRQFPQLCPGLSAHTDIPDHVMARLNFHWSWTHHPGMNARSMYPTWLHSAYLQLYFFFLQWPWQRKLSTGHE